jgi:polysaccharide pyruvyl transferase WcaK-like protein
MKAALLYANLSSNLGDEAVTAGSIRLVERFGGVDEIKVVVPPEQTRRGMEARLRRFRERHPHVTLTALDPALASCLGLERVPDALVYSLVEQVLSDAEGVLRRSGIDDCDLLVYRGGEHLFGRTPGESVALTARVLPLIAGRLRGRRIACLPSTLGPFTTPLARSMARTFVSSCHALALRETASRAFLADVGAPSHRIESVPSLLDPAFFIVPPEGAAPAAESTRGPIAIVPRLDRYGLRVGRAASRKRIRMLRRLGFWFSSSFSFYRVLIERLLDCTDAELRIMVQVRADRELAARLVAEVSRRRPHAGHRLRVVEPPTLEEHLRALAGSRLVVSSRFHSLVFALMLGCPALGVCFAEHGHKIPGLMEMFGLGGFVVDGSRRQSARALALCQEALAAREQLCARSAGTLAMLRADTERWLGAALRSDRAPA